MTEEPGPGELIGRRARQVGGRIVLGLVASFPVAGSVAAALWTGELQARWQRRITTMVEVLRRRVSEIEDHVDLAFIDSEEFDDVFAQAAEDYVRKANAERRHHYASVVVASAVRGEASEEAADRVLRLLGQIRPITLALLHNLAADLLKDEPPRVADFSAQAQKYLAARIPDGDIVDARDFLAELQDHGLVMSGLNLVQGASLSAWSDHDPRATITWRGRETLEFLWPEEFMLKRLP